MPLHPQVHLDVKRDNVMVAADGRVVLVDFGTATKVEEDECIACYAREQVGGNTHHLAPEVMDAQRRLNLAKLKRGEFVLVPLAKQPVFALGVLIVELAMGFHPLLGYPGTQHLCA